MITRQTALALARAYAEIEAAETLLKALLEPAREHRASDIRDAFGRTRGLQLGVPNGDIGYRLYDVPAPLAEIVVKAALDAKRAEIAALSEKARVEIEAQS